MVGYGLVVPLLPFYAREYATEAALVGLLGSLYAAMQFVGGPFLGGLSDRTGRRPVLVVCLLGASLAYLLLGLAQTLSLLFVAVVLAGGAGGTQATAQAYIADSTSPERRARGLGLIGAAFGLGLMAGPALGGLLSLYSLARPGLRRLRAGPGQRGVRLPRPAGVPARQAPHADPAAPPQPALTVARGPRRSGISGRSCSPSSAQPRRSPGC